jgi:signal peptidase I
MRNLFWKLFAALAFSVAGLYLANPTGSATLDPRLRVVGFAPFKVPSQSMAPTLKTGDIILVSAWSQLDGEPKRGDLVVFKHPKMPDVSFVKRIAGLPGDRVEVHGGELFVNDKPIREPYLEGQVMAHPVGAEMAPRTIPQDEFFVLGDNRDNSNDSRFWGNVPRDHLIGQVIRILLAEEESRIGAIH